MKTNEADAKTHGERDNRPKIAVCPIAVKDVIVLKGSSNGLDVKIPKDDGCNKNTLSKDLVGRNEDDFKIEDQTGRMRHFRNKSDEVADKAR